jgi:hypothetical protein
MGHFPVRGASPGPSNGFLDIVSVHNIPLDANLVTISQNSLVEVAVNVIVSQNDIVGIVELDPVPPIADLQAFDPDPADWFLPALPGFQLDPPLALSIEHGPFSRGGFEDNRLVRFA